MSSDQVYRVNRLMQELSDPANGEAFAKDRQSLFDRYGLSREQCEALNTGGRERLTEAGLHPVLQMHHFIVTQPEALEYVSVKAYKHMVDRHG